LEESEAVLDYFQTCGDGIRGSVGYEEGFPEDTVDEECKYGREGREGRVALFLHGCLEVVPEVDGFILSKERREVCLGDVVDCSFAHEACEPSECL
jgi:hypothetical protein